VPEGISPEMQNMHRKTKGKILPGQGMTRIQRTGGGQGGPRGSFHLPGIYSRLGKDYIGILSGFRGVGKRASQQCGKKTSDKKGGAELSSLQIRRSGH